MTLAVALDVLVLAWLLWRQLKVRRVWPRLTLRLAVVLGVLGLVELLDYTGGHRVSAEAAGILTLSFLVGAVALGALRAATVRIWRLGPVVVRQGTWVTVGLWLVSLGLHYGAAGWIDSINGQGGVVSASLLLWLAVTYGIQNVVVHHRAQSLQPVGGPFEVPPNQGGGQWTRWVGPDAPAGGWTGGRPGGAPGAGDAIDASSEPLEAPRPAAHPEPGDEGPPRR